MNAGILDAILYLLLLAGIGFGGIGVIGLLLFPDKWSRMFTGVRATLISAGLVTSAAVVYGIFAWLGRGGVQYGYFILLAFLLYIVIVMTNGIFSSIVLRKKGERGHLPPHDTGSPPQHSDQPPDT